MDQSANWSAEFVSKYFKTGWRAKWYGLTEIERKSIDAQCCSIVDIHPRLLGVYLPYHVVCESDFID